MRRVDGMFFTRSLVFSQDQKFLNAILPPLHDQEHDTGGEDSLAAPALLASIQKRKAHRMKRYQRTSNCCRWNGARGGAYRSNIKAGRQGVSGVGDAIASKDKVNASMGHCWGSLPMVGMLTSPLGGSTVVTLLTLVLSVTLVTCSEMIQNGLVAVLVSSSGLVMTASPGMSETRSSEMPRRATYRSKRRRWRWSSSPRNS